MSNKSLEISLSLGKIFTIVGRDGGEQLSLEDMQAINNVLEIQDHVPPGPAAYDFAYGTLANVFSRRYPALKGMDSLEEAVEVYGDTIVLRPAVA